MQMLPYMFPACHNKTFTSALVYRDVEKLNWSDESSYSQQVGECMCGMHQEKRYRPDCLTQTARDSTGSGICGNIFSPRRK